MKIGINGTGLTARALVKLIVQNEEFKDLHLGQINGRSMSINILKDRLLYSTSQGHSNLDVTIDVENSSLSINNETVKYTAIDNPDKIPWDNDIQIIIEATGKFRDSSKESSDPFRHFKSNNNLKVVLISAPSKGNIENFMWGATPELENKLQEYVNKDEPFVIGGASCTTTAAVPIIDTLDDAFGIESCYLSTIHAVTRSQELLDGSKEWSALDTQLHSTGAADSTNLVLKKNIPMNGIAYRTADKDGSFIQVDAVLKREVTKDDILAAFKASKYAKYISYTKVTNPPSSYVRGDLNMVMLIPDEITIINGNRVIIKGLYDNEEGYAAHLLRLVKFISSILK
ncbi:MAG: aldehyde dehydrogenase [Asgard group archaeon]|nr:aldehyde dehydrogenase [Asgard group archaeon]